MQKTKTTKALMPKISITES